MKKRVLSVLTVAVLLAALLVGSIGATGPGDPNPGTVMGIGSYTLYSQTFVTNTTTLYGGSSSGEATRFQSFNALDVFVTGAISGTRTVTVTMQVSPDGSNWADATYTYVGTPLSYSSTSTNTQTLSDSSTVTATTTSTSTATVTGTMSTSGTSSVTSTVTASGTPTEYESEYQIVLSSDSTDYLRMPVVGMYVRPKIEFSGTVTQNRGITLTIMAVARNN